MADASTVEGRPKKAVKRKRACLVLSTEEKESQIKSLNEEIQGLFRYFHEMITSQRLSVDLTTCGGSLNASVAALMEESSLPLSKLVEEIHMKLKETENVVLTSVAVKSAVVSIGQRVMYGVPNVDVDVLEDHTQACLWCWETRDVKLLPKSVRGALKIRRICRKKIHERITAVSAVVTALQKLESDTSTIHDVGKASEKLGKVLREEDIRVLVDNMLKNSADIRIEKHAKREEKLIIRELERNKREVEKEKKKMDRELQKEKMQHEKEQKRLLEEAEKDERRREKEECEIRKQQRKEQEEAEKDQRRRGREEVELKKQIAIQKQVSIMERFLKRSKTISLIQNDQAFCRESTSDSLSKEYEKVAEAVTVPMDCALLSNAIISVDELRKSHLASWHHFGHFIRSNQNRHWGIRRKPKVALFKELKLSNYKSLAQDDAFCLEKPADRLGEQTTEDRSFINLVDSSPAIKKCNKKKQLLQFDKSHRPAFYGVWPKKSLVVGPRHPLRKDPDLDYDVDSDEEWEEEDPGESLSDCDKDDEEEGSKVEDEEESEDGFFVPDGYLSEDEGAQVDRMNVDHSVEETKSSPSCEHGLENDEFCALVRNQKYLHNLTEHALRKNQPLIIINLRHEKAPLLMAENLCATSKMEQACLQALSMRAFTDGILVEMTVDSMDNEDHEACFSDGKGSTTPVSAVTAILESDLPAVVSVINSSPTGINKVVESLQQKFPSVSKSQLRNTVREISDFNFTNNRWQVKKDILLKLGLSISPEESSGRVKSIAKFFSKRCLPPDGTCMNP